MSEFKKKKKVSGHILLPRDPLPQTLISSKYFKLWGCLCELFSHFSSKNLNPPPPPFLLLLLMLLCPFTCSLYKCVCMCFILFRFFFFHIHFLCSVHIHTYFSHNSKLTYFSCALDAHTIILYTVKCIKTHPISFSYYYYY